MTPNPPLTPHDALAGILHYFKQHTIAILCVKGLIPHPLNIGLMQSVLIRNLTPHLTKISALCIRVDVRYMCKMMNEIFQIPTDVLTVFCRSIKEDNGSMKEDNRSMKEDNRSIKEDNRDLHYR